MIGDSIGYSVPVEFAGTVQNFSVAILEKSNMPFYFQKSVKAGPFRFNFSKSGVGVSIGVRGLRVGTGPRGHYVRAGVGGICYRASLAHSGDPNQGKSGRTQSYRQSEMVFEEQGIEMVDIDSGDVQLMSDESFSDLLEEIRRKQKQPRMATILSVCASAIALFAFFAVGNSAWPILFLALPALLIGQWLDSYQRTTVLFYDLDETVKRAYENMTEKFDLLSDCAGRWHVESKGDVRDLTTWKRNAGAAELVRKKPTTLAYKLPLVIKCNLTPPALHVGRKIIYFLPDIALIEDGSQIGAVGYADLRTGWQDSRFIEENRVPKDADIVDYTWKHPNKSGGPDRRFRDNYQIPICLYEVMHLTSNSGVNELVEFSRIGVVRPFAEALESLPKQAVARSS